MSTNLPRVKQLIANVDELKRFISDVFRKVDQDRSGFLDKREVALVLELIARELGFNIPSTEDAEDIVRMIDKNGDERLSRIEFQTTMERIVQELGKDLLKHDKDVQKIKF